MCQGIFLAPDMIASAWYETCAYSGSVTKSIKFWACLRVHPNCVMINS
jgi:hypothetical protein